MKISHVITAVSRISGFEEWEITGKDRTMPLARYRQIAYFIAKNQCKASLPTIGQAFGGRDHTTIMHGCRKIRQLMDRGDGEAESIAKDVFFAVCRAQAISKEENCKNPFIFRTRRKVAADMSQVSFGNIKDASEGVTA